MKNSVFWDMMSCGSCRNRCFGGTCRLHQQGERIDELGTALAVTRNRSVLQSSTDYKRKDSLENDTREICGGMKNLDYVEGNRAGNKL
jgi:hypothetical protein